MTDKTIQITYPTVVYLRLLFENFNMELLKLTFLKCIGFTFYYSFSIDGQNWSNPQPKEKFVIPDNVRESYIAIWMIPVNFNAPMNAYTLYVKENVDATETVAEISGIEYNGTQLNIFKPDDVRYESLTSVINNYPLWNFYDNQEVTVHRWLEQCNAVNEMYGHTVIYFKTEPVESETVHTFANHVVRNVVSIKRIKINIPNNNLPHDRSAYTDWDYMLQDEFVVHIINDKFRLAFGEDKVPLAKDYLFLPLNNKLYRVSSVQPNNGLMGKVGWWEVFLSKYEEDECVIMSDDIRQAAGFTDFDKAINAVDENVGANDEVLEDEELKRILEETQTYIDEREMSAETVNASATDEKKEATQWFTNKNYDSTFLVDNKETEKQREMIHKRMQIVSVNPSENSFPVQMYNCQTVDKRTIGMVYDLKDYTSVSKNNRWLNDLRFGFNFVVQSYFTGELFDFVDAGNSPVFTVQISRSKLEIVVHPFQQVIPVEYKFEKMTFYRFELSMKNAQLAVKVFTIDNKNKTLDFQDIYILQDIVTSAMILEKMYLFGGPYLTNDIYLFCENKPILKDNCNPILVMNKFND